MYIILLIKATHREFCGPEGPKDKNTGPVYDRVLGFPSESNKVQEPPFETLCYCLQDPKKTDPKTSH